MLALCIGYCLVVLSERSIRNVIEGVGHSLNNTLDLSNLLSPEARQPVLDGGLAADTTDLVEYLSTEVFPTRFVGYAAGGRMTLLEIESYQNRGKVAVLKYKKTDFGKGGRISDGVGLLFISEQRLELPFANYRVLVLKHRGLKLKSIEWQESVFQVLEGG